MLSITRIPFMDEALTASSPKFVAAVQIVSTTEASDIINVNSRARETIRRCFALCCFNATSK